jgi:3-oxoacyl-[acyl-carrier protein] reductase
VELAGKTVVVAGGAGNIGRSVVESLLGAQARVAIIDAKPAQPELFSDPSIAYFEADAADDAAVAAALAGIVEALGSISVLVNCTGTIHSEPLVNILNPAQRRHTMTSWETVIRSNLTAAFVLSANVAEQMALKRTKGVLIHLSSISAAGNPGQTAYSAAKAGVEAMTRVWARELGPLGIRVVAVAPGFVDTPSTHAALNEATVKELARRTPLRRLATTGEIYSAIAFAIGNDFLTGHTIAIDGGLIL